jgi:hypothetical protein
LYSRPYLEKTQHKKRAAGEAQGIGPESSNPALQKEKVELNTDIFSL